MLQPTDAINFTLRMLRIQIMNVIEQLQYLRLYVVIYILQKLVWLGMTFGRLSTAPSYIQPNYTRIEEYISLAGDLEQVHYGIVKMHLLQPRHTQMTDAV